MLFPKLPRISFVVFAGGALAVASCGLISCNAAKPERTGLSAIGEAYAGPANLPLHKDIDPKSALAGTVHHGEKLDILAQRRRWYRVRAQSGLEGWTDDRQLLDKRQMARLRELAKETVGQPSQGAATAFDTLNVHTEPNRQSPSFLQVKEGEKLDVVAHRVMNRGALPKRRLIEPKPRQPRRKKEKKAPKYAEPDPPLPPRPPSDWLKLSGERGIPVADIADEQVAQDDWMLVRTAGGQSGWVLTGRLFLTIPDEVAQYAEGHRIMSYFSIGKTNDGGTDKDIWLWTTADRLGEDHDFDGYRVFTWSLRHHRYETAYIQRRVRGFFPVLAKNGEFSVCLESDPGPRVRKFYTMTGNSVRQSGEKPCEVSVSTEDAVEQNLVNGVTTPAVSPNTGTGDTGKGWLARTKDRVAGWF